MTVFGCGFGYRGSGFYPTGSEINPRIATFVPDPPVSDTLRWIRSACKGGFVQPGFI